jgi:hypothetical protein
MGETAYSYATYLNIKFDPLKLIDVSALAKDVTDKWYNQTLCKVNDSVVRLSAALQTGCRDGGRFSAKSRIHRLPSP